MDFRIVKKGYDTKETKDYILKITKEREEEISKKNAIILNLKDRLSTLSDRVKEMESQKRLISLSLLKAVEKAEEIDAISQQKYSEELASLKSFHIRWTALYNRLIEKYPLDEDLKNAKEFTKKINEQNATSIHYKQNTTSLLKKNLKVFITNKITFINFWKIFSSLLYVRIL